MWMNFISTVHHSNVQGTRFMHPLKRGYIQKLQKPGFWKTVIPKRLTHFSTHTATIYLHFDMNAHVMQPWHNMTTGPHAHTGLRRNLISALYTPVLPFSYRKDWMSLIIQLDVLFSGLFHTLWVCHNRILKSSSPLTWIQVYWSDPWKSTWGLSESNI